MLACYAEREIGSSHLPDLGRYPTNYTGHSGPLWGSRGFLLHYSIFNDVTERGEQNFWE